MSYQKSGIDIPFTSGFGLSRSRQFSARELVNYRVNVGVGLSPENLYQTEGLEELVAPLADAPCRGSHTMNGKPYFVIGTTLYRLDQTINPDLTVTWSTVSLGTVLGSDRVVMDSIWTSTGYEMAIVDPGSYAYGYREADGSITDLTTLSNFLSPVDDVRSINGFLVFSQTDTNKVFHSNLNNILTYNALDFELVTRITKVVGLEVWRGQLYIFGENETLPYTFIGGANFVFQYQPNSTLPGGCVNQYVKTTTGRAFYYLGGEDHEAPAVWASSGGFPEKISTEEIDYIIRGEPLIDSAFMQDFSIDGGKYVALHIGGNCFVYDTLTGRWHTRDSDGPWRANTIVKAYNRLITGDSKDGRIGELSNKDQEYGVPVNRYFVTQPFDANGRYIQVASVMLAMDVGFNGEMTMSYSDDGLTWSQPIIREAGKIGEYGRAVRWDRLGTASFSRMFRFGTSSGVQANVNKVIAL